jgi:ubiquinone/menaquinone biosynthesis C-methylase UbiE
MMTTAGPARYDGFADCYEAFNAPHAAANRPELARTLGAGEGLCLDLGCGTGLYFDAVRATGRMPIGVDRSADQLRYARTRGMCVQADAAALPFPDRAFPTVVMVWLSTDVDDFTAVVREATRVLRPGGLMVFRGAHPCFIGPHT